MEIKDLLAQKEVLEAKDKLLSVQVDTAMDARDRIQVLVDAILNEQRQVQGQISELVKELNKLLREKPGNE